MPIDRAYVTVTPVNNLHSVTVELTRGAAYPAERFLDHAWIEVRNWIHVADGTMIAAQATLARGLAFPFGLIDISVPNDVRPANVMAPGE